MVGRQWDAWRNGDSDCTVEIKRVEWRTGGSLDARYERGRRIKTDLCRLNDQGGRDGAPCGLIACPKRVLNQGGKDWTYKFNCSTPSAIILLTDSMLRTHKMKSQLLLSIILIHGTFGASIKKSEDEDSSEIASTLGLPTTTTEETTDIKFASGSEISPSILPQPSPSQTTPQLSLTAASELSNIKKFPNSIQDKLGTASTIGSPYGGVNGLDGLSVFSRGNLHNQGGLGLGGLNPNLYAGNGYGGNLPHFNQVVQGLTPGHGVGPGLYNGHNGGGVNGNYPVVVQPGGGFQGEEVSVTKEAGVSPLGGVKVSNSINVNSVGVSGPYVDSPGNLYHGYQGLSHHHKAGGPVGQNFGQVGNNVPVHHQGLGNNLHAHGLGGVGGQGILNSPYVGVGHGVGQGNFLHPQQYQHGQGNFIPQQQLQHGYPHPGIQQGGHGVGNGGLAHELGHGIGGFGQNGISGGIYTMNPNLYNQLLDPIYYQKFALQNQHLSPHQGNIQGSYLQQRFPGASRSPFQNQFLQQQQQQYHPHVHHPVNPFSNPFTSPYDLRTTGANRFYTGKNPSGAFRNHKFDSEKEDF